MFKIVLFLALGWLVWTMVLKPRPRPLVGDEAEARAILGVGMDADAQMIREAHRRLVAAVHPDRGGSADLARRINAARDVLLHRKS